MSEDSKKTSDAPANEAKGTTTDLKTVRFKLNEHELEVPLGTSIIEAARKVGVHIPYFCYHPGLTPEGNCRMCLVEVAKSNKPVPACTTPVADGMEVLTDSEGAKSARADVLEFMLLNHPLDCPICDKSGECLLQNHSYDHGKDHSRMVEDKQLKHTKDLGAEIHIWGNRCISCTRCVRFCDEIAGTGELTMVNRGDRSVVDVFPDYPLQNPLAGNVVDLCPVGALISRKFLYQARVWFEQKTPSVCLACARGCSIQIETLRNKVKRLVPRHNPHVNDYWMCDYGRNDFDYILGPERWLRYRLAGSHRPEDAPGFLADQLRAVVREHGPQAVGGLASAFMTLENLYLLRSLFEALEVPLENLAARGRPQGAGQSFKGGFKISGDRNPNRTGVTRILGSDAFDARHEALIQRIRTGDLKGLVLVNDLPHHELDADLLEPLAGLEFVALFLLEADPRLPEPFALMPATAFSERDGTVINEDHRVQVLKQATQLPRGILPEHGVFQGALLALGAREREVSAAGIFTELGSVIPELEGLTHGKVGPLGFQLGEGKSGADWQGGGERGESA